MKQAKNAAQLYSFRDYIGTPAGVRDTLRRLRRTGYEAVQLSGAIAPMPEAELRRMLREESTAGQYRFFVSDTMELFTQNAGLFLGEEIDGMVEQHMVV